MSYTPSGPEYLIIASPLIYLPQGQAFRGVGTIRDALELAGSVGAEGSAGVQSTSGASRGVGGLYWHW